MLVIGLQLLKVNDADLNCLCDNLTRAIERLASLKTLKPKSAHTHTFEERTNWLVKVLRRLIEVNL